MPLGEASFASSQLKASVLACIYRFHPCEERSKRNPKKNPACGRQAGMENNLSYETKKLNKNE